MIHFGTAQATLAGLQALGLGVAVARHGEPAPKTNFFNSLIVVVLIDSILYWGGFFS